MKKHLLFLLLALAGMTWAQNTPMHGWHSYCTNELADVISYGTHTTVAVCYPPEMASNFAGTQISKVAIFSDSLYVGGIYTCSIYLGGDTPSEGSIVYTMSCDVPQGLNDWAEFDVSTPIGVTGNETIWIVWQAEQPLTPYHIGVCGDIDPSGNGIWAWNGTQWEQLWFSTGDWMVKTYFNWDGPQPQPQDVYFAGLGNGMGKIWKNNDLIYSISDSTTSIHLNDLQVAHDGTVYTAGYAYNYSQEYVVGRIWANDTCLFTSDTNTYFDHLVLNGEGWIAAGGNSVWQNGEPLYTYTYGDNSCHINSIAIDTTNNDFYAGGIIETLEDDYYACIWKNDTILWLEEQKSSVEDLCIDGEDLYAAGFLYDNDTLYGIIWQNDAIIVQTENANFYSVVSYDGSLYWTGFHNDTAYVWQDGEVLYTHPNCSGINTLRVNESGVYYLGSCGGVSTVLKDGEILYQPEGSPNIMGLAVIPTPPQSTFTITVESDNPDWGNIIGGGEYHYGDTAFIEAIPNVGHEFLMWNDSITDNPRNIVVTQDSIFIAYFDILQYTINVESANPEWGNVSGSGTYPYGDTVQIEAFPNLGFVFLAWDDGSIKNPRDVIVTENHTYIALFAKQQCVITTAVTPEGAGTVLGGGQYDYGDTISLTAQNNIGYVFSRWDDGVIANPRTLIVENDATYTAIFTPLQYQITTECEPVEGGTVAGAGTYDFGTTARLTATPNDYYSFLCWSDGIASNPREVLVTGNAHYKALFHFNGTPQFTITVTVNDTLLGTVTGGGTYPLGTNIEIVATPNVNAVFSGWDDGNTDNPRHITVTQDMQFKAIFSEIETYTITVRAENPLLGTTYGSGIYPLNQVINIGATPNFGYYFSGWQDGIMSNPRTITVTSNAEYIASFSPNPVETYTITVNCDENQGFIIGAGTYSSGSIANIAAIPADGYKFLKWSDNTSENPKEIYVDHDIELTAYFNTIGVDENLLKAIKLYPNPAQDKICIEGLEKQHEIQIFNAFGMLVKTTRINDEGEINIEELASGLYIIHFYGKALKFMKR